MSHTAGASYHSGNRQGCLRGTRKAILWEIEHWLAGEHNQQIFWLNGLAGTGKSTIAQTFAERMFADGKLGASFFCSRDFADRSNLQAIFPTLAFQLAYQYQLFRDEMLQVLQACPDVAQESLCSQMEKFIVGPLKAANVSTLIIIDALDECKDEEPASAILSILSCYANKIPSVKFFITGRPEPRIRMGFRLKPLLPITEVLKLHEVKPETINNDIKLFFQTQLTELAKGRSDCSFTEDWPSPSEMNILCEKAAGFFIYASTAVKFITSSSHIPTEQLNMIASFPQSTSHEWSSGIDILYTQVLGQAVNDVCVGKEKLYSNFRTVVGAVVLVFNPLLVKALSDLLKVSGISTALRSLHSLLLVPTNKDAAVQIFHKSFPDFLMDSRRCTDHQFFINPSIHHREILFACLNLMRERLKRNICRLDDCIMLSEVKDLPDCRKVYIGDALDYACCFWSKHLLGIPGSSPGVEEVWEIIDEFFPTCLLFWIEALILMGKLDIGIYALNDIQQWYTLVSYIQRDCSEKPIFTSIQTGASCKWLSDSQHFILEHFDTICNSPSQIYHSALPFCPSSSWLHEHYAAELSQEVRVVKGLPTGWGTCSRTVILDQMPLTLAHWKDTIAVGLRSGNIITLDRITGIQTAILSGHTGWVTSLAFSPNGTSLVSGNGDKTIKHWDVQTGGVVKTFHGHTNCVWSVSISADCTKIASRSDDKTIRLWSIQTGECLNVIEQQDEVGHVRFSPTDRQYHVRFPPTDPQYLISVSDHMVWHWNINGHQTKPAHPGSCIDFSLDGTQFVLCHEGNIVVQNSSSGEVLTKFHVADSEINNCCFSPDGRLIATTAGQTAHVWDTASSHPHPIETFAGHTRDITSIAFSSPSSLITLSRDCSVKFWEIGTLQANQVVADPESTSLTPAQIVSITLQTEDNLAISISSDRVVKTWDISTGLCKTSFQTSAKDYHVSNVQLVNGRLVFVWYMSKKFYLWDVEKGELLQTVDAPLSGYIWDIRISGDGSNIFCLYHQFIQAWSTQTGKVVGEVELELCQSERTLIVNGSRVWVHSPESEPLGWDFGTPGSHPIQLSNSPSLFYNNVKLWDIRESRIKNAVTGRVGFQLAGKFARPVKSQWDGHYLVAGYNSGEVLILDFNHVQF